MKFFIPPQKRVPLDLSAHKTFKVEYLGITGTLVEIRDATDEEIKELMDREGIDYAILSEHDAGAGCRYLELPTRYDYLKSKVIKGCPDDYGTYQMLSDEEIEELHELERTKNER